MDNDDSRIFSPQERADYGPQTCPICGQEGLVYSFTQVSDYSSAEPKFMRTRARCTNTHCAINGGSAGELDL